MLIGGFKKEFYVAFYLVQYEKMSAPNIKILEQGESFGSK